MEDKGEEKVPEFSPGWPGNDGEGRNGHKLTMRKLIRCKTTQRFLAGDNGWTEDWNQALVFPTIESARDAVVFHKLKDAELYYLFGDRPSPYDFSISVGG